MFSKDCHINTFYVFYGGWEKNPGQKEIILIYLKYKRKFPKQMLKSTYFGISD